MNKKWISTNQPCVCGQSSDAMAWDSEGNGYCFSGNCEKPVHKRSLKGSEDAVHNKKKKEVIEIEQSTEYKGLGNVAYTTHRGLSESTIRFYDIKTKMIEGTPVEVAFPFPRKLLIRNLETGKIRMEGETKIPGCFGVDKFDPGSKDSVTICVGDWDAPSIYEATRGRTAAISAGGDQAAKRNIIHDRDKINSFKKIILCFDNDDSGQKAAKEVSSLFDFNKLYHVRLDRYKDASDYFQKGEVDNLERAWLAAKRYSPDNIISQFEDIRTALKKSTEDQIGTYPFESLQAMTYGLHKGEIIVMKGFEKIGKQLSLDTKIPTLGGWTTMGELKVGDEILGANGKSTRVSYLTEIQHNVDCYKVNFSDGSSVIAGGPHRWKVIDERNREFIKTTKEILDEGVISRGSVARYSVPLAKALEFEEKKLPIDPYLLGIWLGDGHSYSSGISVGFDDLDEFLLQVNERSSSCVFIRGKTCYNVVIQDLKFKNLRENNLIKNKHIPNEYLRASINQRRELLRGLMDTDGSVSGKGKTGYEFYSSNQSLALQVLELIRSLGYRAGIRQKQSKLYGIDKKIAYTIRFLAASSREVFAFKRKIHIGQPAQITRLTKKAIVSINPVESVPSKCIQVDNPDHLYLCGDGWTVTHNTEIFRAIEYHLLKTTKHNIGIIHLEEDNATTIKGIAGYELGMPAMLPDSGLSEDDIFKAYKQAVSDNDARVHLYQSFETEDEELFLDGIRFLAAGADCKFIFLDHISWLATGKEDEDERKKLDRLSQKIKLLAKELGICILMISHVNDEGKTRGSRNITKVANTIIHMDRDKMSPDDHTRRTTFLSLEGVRLGGSTGPAGKLYMDPSTYKLREMSFEEKFPTPERMRVSA